MKVYQVFHQLMKLHSKEILNFALFDLSNVSFIVPPEKPSLQKDNIFNGLVPNHLSLLRFNVSSFCITVSVNPRLSNQLNSSEKNTDLSKHCLHTFSSTACKIYYNVAMAYHTRSSQTDLLCMHSIQRQVCAVRLPTLKNECQPSCIAHRNQYSGHFSGREIQVFISNPCIFIMSAWLERSMYCCMCLFIN